MFDERESEAGRAAAHERVKEWMRARFDLAEDRAILVAELRCMSKAARHARRRWPSGMRRTPAISSKF
jgi:hypothetical protein